jgi:nucleoside-triphosphatase
MTIECNILITGRPGCGKSTLIADLLKRISTRARGFTTGEIRSPGGGREGFRIRTLPGIEGVLAHKNLDTGPRVGRYRVNLNDLDEIAAAEIENALNDPSTELLIIDEIARMELLSERFRRAALRALDAAIPVLGSIQQRSDPFLDAVRKRTDTRIIGIERDGAAVARGSILSALSILLKHAGESTRSDTQNDSQ